MNLFFPMIAACVALSTVLAKPAVSDTIFLKSGEVRQTVVERFTDGAFWVKEGKKTVVIHPDEILKIVFTPRPETATGAAAAAAVAPASMPPPRKLRRDAAKLLSIPEADASPSHEASSALDSSLASSPDLAILNYRAIMNSGIFQIVGDVENRGNTESRYVKVTVFLMDRMGEVVDQNFSYIRPHPPHLKAGQKKSFQVSFLNPRPHVAKYKIRVESSLF